MIGDIISQDYVDIIEMFTKHNAIIKEMHEICALSKIRACCLEIRANIR